MANPENQSYEPNSSEMPPQYDDLAKVCWDYLVEGESEGNAAIDQAAKAVKAEKGPGGKPDKGGDEDKKKPEPQVTDEEPEIEDEKKDPIEEAKEKMPKEIQEMLDKFRPEAQQQLVKMMSEPENFDQEVVGMMLRNPVVFNHGRRFTLGAKVSFLMKRPQSAKGLDASAQPAIDREAINLFRELQKQRDKLDSSKQEVVALAPLYSGGQSLSKSADMKHTRAHQLAQIKIKEPGLSYDECFDRLKFVENESTLAHGAITADRWGSLKG